ncbi:hypothetical protein JBL43_15705 [Aureibaculum sp. A20]|uniref:Uncharacterized protein n=1 Tax=Aureibaculum flavum TaxID=2795986 RepID=A0ABS0WV43_9FLAO|nr:hypothetical protein [Aureibaculum flavum]MBJ2175698.1 hypothetical protein [Aureibaculum flavum]
MFGLFKKDKEEESDGTQNPEFIELVLKWDSFLLKIETRFNESLNHAEEAVMDNLLESDYDMSKTMRAWSGIKSQISGLSDKIETTFDDKVEPQMLAYVERWDLIDQDQKGVQLAESFYPRIERFEIELEGNVSQKFYNHAIAFLNEDFHCTQCSGKLEVKKDIFRSHYVSCGYCNTVNTFVPNDKIAEIRWVVENIAKHKAIKEWDEKIVAHNKCKSFRSLSKGDDKTKLAKAYDVWEIKEKAFWTKYFTERASFLPEYEETIEHDVSVKMDLYFYDDKKRSDLYINN